MKILIVDDHQLFSDALRITLARAFSNSLIRTCHSPHVLDDNLELLSRYDLVILDYALPEMDGLTLLSLSRRLVGQTKVLVCSGSANESTIRRAMELKVDGFIDKSEPADKILYAIREIMAGRRYYSESFSLMSRAEAGEVPNFSRQQMAILALLQEGLDNKEIACRLFVSVNTIKTHLRLIYEKLDVSNRTSCIKKAQQLGLI
ncbi:response regulator [Marinobacter sp. RI1]|uniref:response regulator transcription factor n=1 Tax=Marinobacter sp. RI1 TaxID=3158171 RepID=UPI0034E8DC80